MAKIAAQEYALQEENAAFCGDPTGGIAKRFGLATRRSESVFYGGHNPPWLRY
jgi:hypothetical protein